jgi:hypothetical protein
MSDYADLIERLAAVASHLEQDVDGNPVAAAVNKRRAETVDEGIAVIHSLRASLANEKEAREKADALATFFETEMTRILQEGAKR